MKLSLSRIVLIIVILSIAVKVCGLAAPIYDDEANYAFSITNADSFGFNPYYYSPLLMQWIGIIFTSLLGVKTWVFRFIPFIFSFLTLALTCSFAKERYNKKTALLAVSLLCASFYFTLASLQLDVEGSLVMFFVLASMYSYTKYEKTKQFSWQLLTGICLGLSLLSKHNAIIAFIVLGIYTHFKTKKLKQTISNLFVPFSAGIGIYALYVLLAFAVNPAYLDFIFSHGATRVGVQLTALSPIMFVFWATPLLIGLALLSLLKIKKQDWLFIIWIAVTILFNTFVISRGDFSRYYMHIIPAMAILSAVAISRIKVSYKQLYKIGLVAGMYYLLLLVLNYFELKIVPRIMSDYLAEIKSLNLNFLFSYTTSSGPAFGVSFATIALTLFLSAVLIVGVLLFRNSLRHIGKVCLIFFIAVNLAFNIFLIQEYIFQVQGPDPGQAVNEMIDYFKENDLKYPIYTNDEGIMFYLDNSYIKQVRNNPYPNLIGLPDNELDDSSEYALERVKADGGTILLLNWPPIPEQSPAWDVIEQCELEKIFVSKRYEIGYIYNCVY